MFCVAVVRIKSILSVKYVTPLLGIVGIVVFVVIHLIIQVILARGCRLPFAGDRRQANRKAERGAVVVVIVVARVGFPPSITKTKSTTTV